MMRAEKGEDVAAYTTRLQVHERFMRWVISTALQSPEDAQLLQMADTQFFKMLKTALPTGMEYMGSISQSGGFTKLCSMVLESSASSSQNMESPKKVVFVNLKGKLASTPGSRVTGETRTEQHNRTVVTQYHPKSDDDKDEDQPSEEEDLEARVSRIIAKQLKATKSPAKSRSFPNRDGGDGQTDTGESDQNLTERVVSLLKELQDKSPQKKATGNECFAYVKSGTCARGDKCKFAHPAAQGGDSPPPYPPSPKRRRQESPPRKGECYAYQRGACKKGDQCTFSHARGGDNRNRMPNTAAMAQANRECAQEKNVGTCRDKKCRDFHGKFNAKSDSTCNSAAQHKPCYHLWTIQGCRYSHILPQQDRRTEDSSQKNGRGSGRADRYKR